ncbi:MAG: NAD kinase [Bacteroidetes bacterium]|nr:NAD kinase [Bacteroidota bacterium]HET6245510.1 NAD kinase [Bacteroidia bacterium]
MRIAIYGREFNEKYDQAIQFIFNILEKKGVELVVFEKFNDFLKEKIKNIPNYATFNHYTQITTEIDFILSIGGDGTLLDTVTFIRDSKVPVIGFNTGRLGFLSTVSMNETETAINALINKEYTLDERNLLRLQTKSNLFGNLNFALNELTIHKKDSASMMTIHAYINGNYLNSYWADGLIVSTPTGSTAYSLSCGGPIIIPGSENFIITPIAPHNLNVRPIVLPANNTITLKFEGRSKKYLVALDSRTETVNSTEELTISEEKFKVNLIRLSGHDFLTTLRNKLMWGLDLRN